MKTTLRRTEPYKWLKKTAKPLRTVLIEESLKALKSSTWRTQTCSIFVKQVVWRDPGGS